MHGTNPGECDCPDSCQRCDQGYHDCGKKTCRFWEKARTRFARFFSQAFSLLG